MAGCHLESLTGLIVSIAYFSPDRGHQKFALVDKETLDIFLLTM